MATVTFTYFPLLLLCVCSNLSDSSQFEIFYPFGRHEGDSVVTVGDYNCDGPINIPHRIFNYSTLYVSVSRLQSVMRTTLTVHTKT